MMSNPWFDQVVLLLILANSGSLAAEDPLATTTNPTLEKMELAFNILFTAEMFIKMVALGVFGKDRYLHDPWNKMDFFVVFMGWLPLIMALFTDGGGANFTAIRTVRILKVLKTVQRVEGVRRLVAALLSSIPLLLNVGNLLAFMFFVFGIFGLQVRRGRSVSSLAFSSLAARSRSRAHVSSASRRRTREQLVSVDVLGASCFRLAPPPRPLFAFLYTCLFN